jgi:hypothetical protein
LLSLHAGILKSSTEPTMIATVIPIDFISHLRSD